METLGCQVKRMSPEAMIPALHRREPPAPPAGVFAMNGLSEQRQLNEFPVSGRPRIPFHPHWRAGSQVWRDILHPTKGELLAPIAPLRRLVGH